MKHPHISLLLLVLFGILVSCGEGKKEEEPAGETSPFTVADAHRLNTEAILHMDQDDVAGAIPMFRTLCEETQNLFVPRFNLAIALLNAQNIDRKARKAEMDESESLLRQLMEEFPDRVEAPYSLAVMLEHLGRDPVEIEELYALALRLAPASPDCLYRLGKFYYQKRNPDLEKAEALLKRALELEGHFAGAWNTFFGTLKRRGKRDVAKEAMKTFMLYSDSLPEQSKRLSLVYNFMGTYASCVRELDLPFNYESSPQVSINFESPPKTGGQKPRTTTLVSPSAHDIDGDGKSEFIMEGQVFVPKGNELIDVSKLWNLPENQGVLGSLIGDLNHDKQQDILLFGNSGITSLISNGDHLVNTRLWQNHESATADVQIADVDHDGDLDIVSSLGIYTNLRPTIYENAKEGKTAFRFMSWTKLHPEALGYPYTSLIDIDRDGDLDIIRSSETKDAIILINNRLWRFQLLKETPLSGVRGPLSLADFDQDGRQDIFVPGPCSPSTRMSGKNVRVMLNRFPAPFVPVYVKASPSINSKGTLIPSPYDLDNDGDYDIVLTSRKGEVFVATTDGGNAAITIKIDGYWGQAICRDIDGDGLLDMALSDPQAGTACWIKNTTEGGGNYLRIQLQGKRSNGNASSWSNHFGIGAFLEIRAEGRAFYADYHVRNGNSQTQGNTLHVGIGQAKKVDSIRVLWPDFVLQNEAGVSANQMVTYEEVNRKASSCPVLFKYSGTGESFEFVTDFLGVGGLGFFMEPETYAPADNNETVRIGHLPEKNGRLELRICEPMEEITYLDQLRLIAVDHPEEMEIQADERLATSAPNPTGEPRAFQETFLPTHGQTNLGKDCLAELREKDRIYQPDLIPDKRFVGYLQAEHSISLGFDFDAIRKGKPSPQSRLILLLDGWVEYPYSHVNYAAWEAGVQGESLSIDRSDDGHHWIEAIAKAGYPGGMTRCMSLDVTKVLQGSTKAIRLRTNLEIHIDRVRLAWEENSNSILVHEREFSRIELGWRGYPKEKSPDGKEPKIYDYQDCSDAFDWKSMKGRFTAYGDVKSLLANADGRLVIMNHGEELSLSLDANAFPPCPQGWKRTFFLRAVGWCKDMDPYTAFPDTVAPMPHGKEGIYPAHGSSQRTAIGNERQLSGTFR